MIIKQITPFLVDRFLLVRVYTDQGIVGNGEAGLWAHQKTVYHAIQELSQYYIGKDPTRIEHHYQVVSRNTHFMGAVLNAAISAIDVALWDILGQSVDLPVYQLLGGKCRDRIRVFNNVSGNTLADLATSAVQNVENGFTSLRASPFFPGWESQPSTQVISPALKMPPGSSVRIRPSGVSISTWFSNVLGKATTIPTGLDSGSDRLRPFIPPGRFIFPL